MEISWNPSKCLPNMRSHSETPSCIPLAPNYKILQVRNYLEWALPISTNHKQDLGHDWTQHAWQSRVANAISTRRPCETWSHSIQSISVQPFFFFGSFVCFTSGSCGLDKLVEPPKENRVILMSLPATGGRRDVTKHFFHDLSPRILEHAHMASPLLQESRSWRYSFPDLSPWRRTFQEWRACHMSSSSASSSAAPWTEQIRCNKQQLCCSDRTDSISWLSVLPDAPCDTFKDLIDVIINFQLLQLRLRQCSTSHCSVLDAPQR